ncbi:hypothetical protein BQ8420_05940 [Nocardiopsis sp. JB363]|nr:hypothetical protein BQ8420_05940 [Nocardiopsis sp. JB363]
MCAARRHRGRTRGLRGSLVRVGSGSSRIPSETGQERRWFHGKVR